MTRSVEHFGVVYDEKTDWRAFLKDVLSGGVYKGLNLDRHIGLSMPDALGELAEALIGTPMETGFADAALEIIERGNQNEMEIVRSAGWAKAPNAFERTLAIVQNPGRRVSDEWLIELYGELLRMRPTDSRLLDVFTKDACKARAPVSLLSLAARYNVDWLVEHLPSLRPPVNANMWEWVYDAGMGDGPVSESDRPTLEANRARLLTAIAALGQPYVQALTRQVEQRLPKTKIELTRALLAHPAFAHP